MRRDTGMRVGITTDHGGFGLKEDLVARLRAAGYEIVDFGANALNPDDDYPDFVVPLARAVAAGSAARWDRKLPGTSCRPSSPPSSASPRDTCAA